LSDSVPKIYVNEVSFLLFCQNVGFIGLGNMGFRMVNNLIRAGYKVTVHDINRDVMKMFTEMGVSSRETPYEVAQDSEVVITMLPSSSHEQMGCFLEKMI
jgi:3-hydroxyisobutyrate dehydrogenase-like beta-hydroxyacid dehydrogenase